VGKKAKRNISEAMIQAAKEKWLLESNLTGCGTQQSLGGHINRNPVLRPLLD
jgi:hypothetical protein